MKASYRGCSAHPIGFILIESLPGTVTTASAPCGETSTFVWLVSASFEST
jgi:hypothetical protein